MTKSVKRELGFECGRGTLLWILEPCIAAIKDSDSPLFPGGVALQASLPADSPDVADTPMEIVATSCGSTMACRVRTLSLGYHPGGIVVDGDRLHAMIAVMPDDIVSVVATTDKKVSLYGPTGRRFSVDFLPLKDFPVMPTPPADSPEVVLPCADLLRLLESVQTAIDDRGPASPKNSVQLRLKERLLQAVATSNSRLVVAAAAIDNPSEFSVMLPRACIPSVLRICEGNEFLRLAQSPKDLFLTTGAADSADDVLLACRLPQGDFQQWELARDGSLRDRRIACLIDGPQLAGAMRALQVVDRKSRAIEDRVSTDTVIMSLKGAELTLRTSDRVTTVGEETLAVTNPDGQAFELVCSAFALRDSARSCPGVAEIMADDHAVEAPLPVVVRAAEKNYLSIFVTRQWENQ